MKIKFNENYFKNSTALSNTQKILINTILAEIPDISKYINFSFFECEIKYYISKKP